jgi:hypothetical protein
VNNKYLRKVPTTDIDVYRVLSAFLVTDPAIQHAIKKLLCSGLRGYKDFRQDVTEAIQSLNRCLEMLEEDDR